MRAKPSSTTAARLGMPTVSADFAAANDGGHDCLGKGVDADRDQNGINGARNRHRCSRHARYRQCDGVDVGDAGQRCQEQQSLGACF